VVLGSTLRGKRLREQHSFDIMRARNGMSRDGRNME